MSLLVRLWYSANTYYLSTIAKECPKSHSSTSAAIAGSRRFPAALMLETSGLRDDFRNSYATTRFE
jgi:hypothetical protein